MNATPGQLGYLVAGVVVGVVVMRLAMGSRFANPFYEWRDREFNEEVARKFGDVPTTGGPDEDGFF